MAIEVTVTDTEAGESQTTQLREDHCAHNYVIFCGPGTALVHKQTYLNGTEVLTLKYSPDAGREPGIKKENL